MTVSTFFMTQLGAIALGVSVITGALALFTLWFSRQKNRELLTQIQRLQHDLKVANNGAIGMGQHLTALEKRVHQSHKPQAEAADNHQILAKAKNLLIKGSDVDAVAKECGLSYAEVSLMSALHRQGKLEPKVRPINTLLN